MAPSETYDRSYGVQTASVSNQIQPESIRSAIERFSKIEDHLAMLRDRLQGIRDLVSPPGPPGPQSASTGGPAKPPYAGVVGALHGLADAISDRASAIDRLISDIVTGVG